MFDGTHTHTKNTTSGEMVKMVNFFHLIRYLLFQLFEHTIEHFTQIHIH